MSQPQQADSHLLMAPVNKDETGLRLSPFSFQAIATLCDCDSPSPAGERKARPVRSGSRCARFLLSQKYPAHFESSYPNKKGSENSEPFLLGQIGRVQNF